MPLKTGVRVRILGMPLKTEVKVRILGMLPRKGKNGQWRRTEITPGTVWINGMVLVTRKGRVRVIVMMLNITGGWKDEHWVEQL